MRGVLFLIIYLVGTICLPVPPKVYFIEGFNDNSNNWPDSVFLQKRYLRSVGKVNNGTYTFKAVHDYSDGELKKELYSEKLESFSFEILFAKTVYFDFDLSLSNKIKFAYKSNRLEAKINSSTTKLKCRGVSKVNIDKKGSYYYVWVNGKVEEAVKVYGASVKDIKLLLSVSQGQSIHIDSLSLTAFKDQSLSNESKAFSVNTVSDDNNDKYYFEDPFFNNDNNWNTDTISYSQNRLVSTSVIEQGVYKVENYSKYNGYTFEKLLSDEIASEYTFFMVFGDSLKGDFSLTLVDLNVKYDSELKLISFGETIKANQINVPTEKLESIRVKRNGETFGVAVNELELKLITSNVKPSKLEFKASVAPGGQMEISHIVLSKIAEDFSGDLTYSFITDKVNSYVKKNINEWLIRGKYEATVQYEERTSEEGLEKQKAIYEQEIINNLSKGVFNCSSITNDYNPNEAYFTLHQNELNDIYVHIPIDEAKSIDEEFCQFHFQNEEFSFEDGKFHLDKIELVNKASGKRYFAFDEVSKAQHYNKENYRDVNTMVDEYTVNQLEGAKNYLLVIGVEDYQDESLNDLNHPVGDCQRLVTALTNNYTFYNDNITFLKNPTRSEIISAFDKLSRTVGEKDNLMIFYAGHGVWDKTLKKGYWLPVNAMKSNRANWFSNSSLKDYISGINSQHTLLVSDACFSGGIFKTRNAFHEQKAMQELYKLPSRKALTSGALNTVPDKSVFIEYFIKRLDENQKKTLSTSQLFSSFRIAVINNSPNSQVPLYGDIKETGDEGGEFIFIKQ